MADSTLFDKYGRTIKDGKIIFNEGEEGTQMFIIQEGKVRITKRIGGREHILAVLEKGDFFGEMAIVNQVKRTASATAVGEVSLLAFDRAGFVGMIEKNSKITMNVIDKLCRRLQHANMQIQHLVKRDEKSLVALNLYYAFVEAAAETEGINRSKTLDELSLTMEIPEKKVEEYIKGFEQSGVVRIESGIIKLLDKNRLYEMAEHARAYS
ncbi:MAG: cyclic nucleotide-binding domain-containing protein [Spirochaetales bacterium]|nr:cyclic nucleotide-binding domain-containing protein [Spirochaetales bacterium]MCF7939575.1 cyclic nucleotide-binding domain-containing protein [Spirochaetales bacterium]